MPTMLVMGATAFALPEAECWAAFNAHKAETGQGAGLIGHDRSDRGEPPRHAARGRFVI